MQAPRSSGRLARVAAVGALVVALLQPARATAAASPFRVLHDVAAAEGTSPRGELIRATDGSFYGLLTDAIFRMDRSGNVTIVHRFTEPDDQLPAGLIQGSDGFFYGTTARGGTPTNPYCVLQGGCGTFFRMDASGTVVVLHSFEWGTADGNWPNGGIVQGPDGRFYGTTFQGGNEFPRDGGFGIAYAITPSGAFTVLHRFTLAEGINPNGGLIRASDGNFYGVTNQYGPNGGGTVFRMDAAGTVAVVHGFGFGDGWEPKARLLEASDGLLYGTAESGGAFGAGVVFRVALDGSPFEVVHAFDQWGSDGYRPTTALVQGRDGRFYGTAPIGGLGVYAPSRSGVVYRMTGTGVVSVLHTFVGPDGSTPMGPLLETDDGALLGSTFAGGSAGGGVVFEVDPTAPLPVASLSITPNPLPQGQTGTGTITLSAAAPTGGTVVELSTNNEGAAQVPRTVTVPAGRTSASFPVSTEFPIFSTASLLVFASVDGAGISSPLTVGPDDGSSTPTLASLQLDPTSVQGGGTVVGTVRLAAAAPLGGAAVALSSSRARIAQVPSSVTVPAGATSATFTVTTRRASRSRVVTITASLNGSTESAQLTVTR